MVLPANKVWERQIRAVQAGKQAENYKTEYKNILDLAIYFSKQKDCYKYWKEL